MMLLENLNEEFATALLEWFREKGVAYPWADSPDAWGIWVSEVMLQQTTVAAVEPRYRRWMERFPSTESLAAADEEEVLREWEGLGYYNRARNLASAAAEIHRSYGGIIPEEASELRQLPGVGEYIAAAVSSFAFSKRQAAIDANGRRIAQRLSGRESWDKELETALKNIVEELMPLENPGSLNAALMQLGQQVCIPRSPRCGECPLAGICLARSMGVQDVIPARRRKEVIPKKTRLAILFNCEKVLMWKKNKGIGRGLWVFPPENEIEGLEKYWKVMKLLPEQIHSYTRYRDVLIPRIFRRKDELGVMPSLRSEKSGFFLPGMLQELPMPTAYRRVSDDLIEFLKSDNTHYMNV
ncbi:MAG: A/G-specific adenine glycosylase [Deltaproteobacteria bacterium]|nr:MAG: A/G-specific adenine glycosylase [Spirochaetota bacterium]RLC31475.1 MAG: A/G-specific adenine glycosylase [Deltaproteobacteria bacterium]